MIEPKWLELFQINCLWIGPSLRPIDVVCLLSMLRAGHQVTLWTYEPVANVPAGVDVADARQILSREKIIFHRRTGSPALGANIFRYALMKAGRGLWLDLDILLLRPIRRIATPLFGFQDEKYINNAVLFLPDGHLVEDLIDFTSSPHPIPPFYRPEKRLKLQALKLIGRPVAVEDMKWGVFGPQALTYFAKKREVDQLALAPSYFYPVPPGSAASLLRNDRSVRHHIRPETIAVHLWAEMLRGRTPQRDSFLEAFARTELGFNFGGFVGRDRPRSGYTGRRLGHP